MNKKNTSFGPDVSAIAWDINISVSGLRRYDNGVLIYR
jgi:hypothetical protein